MLKEAIINNVIEPYNRASTGAVLAQVYELDDVTNRAKITFKDPKGTGFIKLENVPIQIGNGGMHSAGPLVGDQVWVTFINNSPLLPKIVSLCDENYEVNTREKTRHLRKGAFLPDSICDRSDYKNTSTVTTDTPTINDWIDDTNTDINKYINYKDTNPMDELVDATSYAAYYNTEEPGITHPANSSTIKVKNNGMIDIFVSTNQGIRIDPSTKTVNFICNSEKHHVSDLSVFASNSVNIDSAKDLNLKSDKISINATSADIKVDDKWTVVVNSDINIKSNSNITLDAKEDINILGSRIIFKGKTFINRDDILEAINE